MTESDSARWQPFALTALTALWLAGFVYLGLASRLPSIPALTGRGESLALTGHFGTTLVLAVLMYGLLRATNLDRPTLPVAAISFGFAVAVGGAIELLQSLSATRTPEWLDWLFDGLGALLAVAVLAAIDQQRRRRRALVVSVQLVGTLLLGAGVAAFLIWPPPAAEEVVVLCPQEVDQRRVPRPDVAAGSGARVEEGLLVSYDFASSGLAAASDPALDLGLLGDASLEDQSLRFSDDGGVARTDGGAAILQEVITQSDAFTVEAWVRPRDLLQSGPARIVSMSASTSLGDVNFHLGQERTCLSVRVRSDVRGAEWLLAEGVFTAPQASWHLAVTYQGGSTAVYVDGTLVEEYTIEPGPLEYWNPGFPLLVGNEATLDRPFLGDVFSLAVYGRALTFPEIAQNYQAGPIR